MAPPTFGDLGKSAKDLFNKGYNVGLFKIDSTTRAGEKNDVEFKVNTAHNLASGKIAGGLDAKYKIPQYGLTLTEKWNTDNTLGTVLEVNEQFGRGLKITLDSLYQLHAGKRSAKLKADYALPSSRITVDSSLTSAPVLNAAAVFQKDSNLLGASVTFDTASNKLVSNQIAVSKDTKEYAFTVFCKDQTDFSGSFFQKVAPSTEVGAQLGFKMGGEGVNFAIAAKHAASRDVIIRAKLDNKSTLAVALTHALSPSLKLNLTSQLNLHSNQDHKFGLGLEFDPVN